VNDLREEHDEKAFDLMCGNSDSASNDINESEFQDEKQYEQGI
jgi:hypothetical protein